MNHTQSQLLYYSKELKNNNFDGWLNSNVINKSFIEIGLINDHNIYEILKTEKLKKDWLNHNNANNIISQKKWGTNYSICSIENPIIIKLNEKYKFHIEKYLEDNKKSKYYLKFTLQVLLINAVIEYHYGIKKDIIWNISNFDYIDHKEK